MLALQFLFDGLQLCPHAVPPGLPFDLEFSLASFAADKGEAQVKVSGLPSPRRLRFFQSDRFSFDEP
jgi:hypothetical protein